MEREEHPNPRRRRVTPPHAAIGAPASIVGEDGVVRPAWAATDEEMRRYHDEEWGRPVTDERGMFEALSLEAFQAGLAWATVLRKRAALRAAFLNFEPAKVAALTDQDVARLKADSGLIRHEAKIRATISNAAATLALREEGGLVELVHSFAVAPDSPTAGAAAEHRTRSPESEALAAALRGRGFRFVGPTNMYALLQAVGLAPR